MLFPSWETSLQLLDSFFLLNKWLGCFLFSFSFSLHLFCDIPLFFFHHHFISFVNQIQIEWFYEIILLFLHGMSNVGDNFIFLGKNSYYHNLAFNLSLTMKWNVNNPSSPFWNFETKGVSHSIHAWNNFVFFILLYVHLYHLEV